MNWTFEISTGKMYRPDGSLAGTGYAGGDLGKVPAAVDNPADESQKDIGPLPEGWYTFGSARNSPTLGPLAIPLYPDPENQMYSRSGFWLHADSEVNHGMASEGCIVLDHSIRQEMESSPMRRLKVVAVIGPTT